MAGMAGELSLPQICAGNGGRGKGKRELCRKIETVTKCESAGVRRRKSKKSREQNPKQSRKTHQNALCTKPNSRARNEHRAPPCGGDVKTGRRITRKIPQGKLNRKPQNKNECPPKKQTSKPGTSDQNTRGQQLWPERQLATSAPRDSSTSLCIPRATDLPRRSYWRHQEP